MPPPPRSLYFCPSRTETQQTRNESSFFGPIFVSNPPQIIGKVSFVNILSSTVYLGRRWRFFPGTVGTALSHLLVSVLVVVFLGA